MAFKTAKDYNEERYGGLFLLRDDGDYADVIFLYQSDNDVLIADTHYIKSASYTGYVHCCGKNCPACAKGIHVQTKLFIPLYNTMDHEVQFWDRGVRFQNQLFKDVFSKYPNPSEYIFRITRHGATGDMNTVYSITAVFRNTKLPYDRILEENKIMLPEAYSSICKEYMPGELYNLINVQADASLSSGSTTAVNATSLPDMPDYQITPRGANPSPNVDLTIPEIPDGIDDEEIGDDLDNDDVDF